MHLCFVIDASCFVLTESLCFRVALFSNRGPFLSGATKKSQQIRFHCYFVCSRYPALPYGKILLLQQAQDQIGTGFLVNFWMVLRNRELFVIAPMVELHNNQTVFHLHISFWFRVMNSSNWCFCLYQI